MKNQAQCDISSITKINHTGSQVSVVDLLSASYFTLSHSLPTLLSTTVISGTAGDDDYLVQLLARHFSM